MRELQPADFDEGVIELMRIVTSDELVDYICIPRWWDPGASEQWRY
jgi:hypothetical protein